MSRKSDAKEDELTGNVPCDTFPDIDYADFPDLLHSLVASIIFLFGSFLNFFRAIGWLLLAQLLTVLAFTFMLFYVLLHRVFVFLAQLLIPCEYRFRSHVNVASPSLITSNLHETLERLDKKFPHDVAFPKEYDSVLSEFFLLLSALAYESYYTLKNDVKPILDKHQIKYRIVVYKHQDDVENVNEYLDKDRVAILFYRNGVVGKRSFLVVVMKGTSPFNWTEWLEDASIALIPPAEGTVPSVGLVHQGFYSKVFLNRESVDYRTVQEKNDSVISNIKIALQKTLENEFKGADVESKVELWITGHSLGAAMASMLTAAVLKAYTSVHSFSSLERFVKEESKEEFMKDVSKDLHLPLWFVENVKGTYGFGTPRIGDKYFATACDHALHSSEKIFFRVNDGSDAVTVIPLGGSKSYDRLIQSNSLLRTVNNVWSKLLGNTYQPEYYHFGQPILLRSYGLAKWRFFFQSLQTLVLKFVKNPAEIAFLPIALCDYALKFSKHFTSSFIELLYSLIPNRRSWTRLISRYRKTFSKFSLKSAAVPKREEDASKRVPIAVQILSVTKLQKDATWKDLILQIFGFVFSKAWITPNPATDWSILAFVRSFVTPLLLLDHFPSEYYWKIRFAS